MSSTFEPRVIRQALGLCTKTLTGSALALGLILPAQAFSPLSGPVESMSAVAPNVVILFDNSSSMRGDVNSNYGTGRGTERLVIAKQAVKDVIADNRNLRFGLFVFNSATGTGNNRETHGGRLLVSVNDVSSSTLAGRTNYTTLIDQIEAITAIRPGQSGTSANDWTYTPLAESYYELTRYMRGLKPFYSPTPPATAADLNGRTAFQSPIQFRCQRNFGLIVTDGLPTYDSQFPTLLTSEPDAGPLIAGQDVQDKLRNWYDAAPSLAGVDVSQEGATFFLNDIARFAYDIDMRTAARDSTDDAGVSWDDPRFPKQNMRTYTIGFTVNDPRLGTMADAGNGQYYTAGNSAQLNAALTSALQEINAAAGSGGGGAVSSSELSAGSLYYRTLYDPETWRGEIQASSFDEAGALGTVSWTTNTTMTPSQRASKYQTWNVNTGVVTLGSTTYASLPPAQQEVLTASAALVGNSATGQSLLNWAIGANNAAPFRPRNVLLGDIVNSSPAYADPAEATHLRTDTSYATFLGRKATQMVPSLVVGSNDGFLHVLAAREHVNGAATTTAGKHRLAFLPAAMHQKLGTRARPDYGRAVGHVSGVDGNIAVADAQLGGVWTTLALTGFGAGGKGLISAKLFDGRASGDGNDALGALWERGPGTDFEELGHIYGRPAVGKLNGQWVTLVGNGYGGASGQAVLYIIKLADGSLLKSIPVGTAGGNGLSMPRLQLDKEGNVVSAYAGDLKGQLWKFDLSSDVPASWGSAFSDSGAAVPLFTAATGQPITVTPEFYRHPQGGQLVLFGTGKFMEQADLTSTAEQAYYAVWDKPGIAGGLDSSRLLAQSILSEASVRTVSAARVNWDTQLGWYLPLKVAGGTLKGERVTRNTIVRGNRVFFNTGFIDSASNDPCISSANGWLMALDVFSGGRLATAIFDSNNDGIIDGRDDVTAGLKLDIGLPGDLTFVSRPGSGVLLDGRSEAAPDLSGRRRVTAVGGRLPAGLLRPTPVIGEDGVPVPVSGGYLTASSTLCNPATQTCECPESSTSCVSVHTRPSCDGGTLLAGGSQDVKQISLRLHCVARRIAWRQLM